MWRIAALAERAARVGRGQQRVQSRVRMAAPLSSRVNPDHSVEETVAIVDRDGNVVSYASRREMRAKNLRHRATFIFAQDRSGRLYVQKRAQIKDYCPGMYEPCSGGVLQRGEEVAESAVRELEEELGIAGVPLRECGSFVYEDDATKVVGSLWDCTYEGPLRLQESEVEAVELWTAEECWRRHRGGESVFTPDGLAALQKYQDFVREHGPSR